MKNKEWDRTSLILFLVAGICLGLAGILNVTSSANVRWIDVMQVFVGGMICGAMLSNGYTSLRRGAPPSA